MPDPPGMRAVEPEIGTVESLKALGQRLSNWGRWGDADERGTVNFLTAERRLAATRLVRTGALLDLGMPFDDRGPQTGNGRFNPIHLMSLVPSPQLASSDGMIGADDVITMPLQCATQWDSLAHCGYDGLLYNATPAHRVNVRYGAEKNSFARVAGRLVGRGVLLDVAGLKGRTPLDAGEEVTAEDLSRGEERQGVRVGSGDILLVRTGWYQHFLDGRTATFMGDEPGLGLSTLAWLHDREVAAVAVDNWAAEVIPSRVNGSYIPFHMVAIRDIGLLIGEMFNFEALAAACRADGVWEFLFCAPGLNITGSVGSPITPVAVL